MRVLVCGGRDFSGEAFLFGIMDELHERHRFTLLIHGAARGADDLAGKWGQSRGVPVKACPANWALHGKAAGPIRNSEMLSEGHPELVVAFYGGSGTADMVRKARAAGVPVILAQ